MKNTGAILIRQKYLKLRISVRHIHQVIHMLRMQPATMDTFERILNLERMLELHVDEQKRLRRYLGKFE